MVDKVSIEFDAIDDKLTNKLKALDTKLNELGDSANYTSSLRQNISELNANIQQVEKLKNSIISTQKEISKLSIPAGGTKRSRSKQYEQLEDIGETAQRGSSRAQSASNNNRRSIPNSRATVGTPSYYTPRLNEPSSFARQREDSRQELRDVRSRYSGLSRDAGTSNRSIIQSDRRLNTKIKSGGYISSGEKITADNNLKSAREILTDNGRYSSTSGRIDEMKNRVAQNNSSRDSIQSQIKDMTKDGKSNLSDAQKKIVQSLEHQRSLLEKENQGIISYTEKLNSVKKNYDSLNSTMSSSEAKYAPTSGLSGTLFKRSQNIANGVVYGGAAATAGLAAKGLSTINQDQPYTRAIGATNGTYNSRAAQLSAQNSGMQYGITGSEMLKYENTYMQGKGYTSEDDMNNAGKETGMFSKITGLTSDQSNSLTDVYSNSNNDNSQGLKDLQNTFYGSLKQAGLTNKSYGQASQLSSILGNYSSLRGGDASTSSLSGQVAMQSALGSTGNSALQGKNGASFMNQMNSSIIGQGANSKFMQAALMTSDPTKYNGSASGYANIVNATQQGLTGSNLSAIVNTGNQYTQGMSKKDSDLVMSQALNNNFGTQLTGKSYSSIRKLVASGKLDGLSKSDTIKKMQQEGAITSKEAKSMQQNSSDSSADKGTAALEKASTTVGNVTRNLVSFGERLTGGSATLTILATAATGAALALGKIALSTTLSNTIKNGASGGGGGFLGGSGKNAKGGTTGGSSSGGKTTILSRAKNTKVGQKVTAGVESVSNSKFGNTVKSGASTVADSKFGGFFMSGANKTGNVVKSGASKATGLLSKAGSYLTSSKASPLLSGAGKVVSAGNKALPWLSAASTAYGVYSDVKSGAGKKKIGGDIGSGVGSVAGAALLSPLGPLGMLAGGTLGGLVGNGLGSMVGGLFGSSGSKQKDDQSLTNKKLQSEQMRSKNIKADDEFVNKYGRTVTSKNALKDSSSSNSVSSDSSTSPFEDYKNTGSAKGSAGTAVTHNVVISGTVEHTGEVADMSNVEASTDGVLQNLFGTSSANETKRV